MTAPTQRHVPIVGPCRYRSPTPGRRKPEDHAKRKHCLLIVDDEPNVCDSVHDLLRREFRVLKAHSAEEGYRLMQEEEVHIVMSDQRMPQITGVELLTKVKSRYPQAVRMLFTGFADLESIIAAINQGHVFQFLKKPWQPEELRAAVQPGRRRIRPAGADRPRAGTACSRRSTASRPALRARVRGPPPPGTSDDRPQRVRMPADSRLPDVRRHGR